MFNLIEHITFSQALYTGFLVTCILWTILWQYEARYFRQKADHLDILRGYFCESLSVLDIAIAYFEPQKKPFINDLFFQYIATNSKEDIRSTIISYLQNYYAFSTWEDLTTHLETQVYPLMYVFEKDGRSYCLNARGMNGVIYTWIHRIKSSENDYIYTKRMIDNIPIALWYRNHKGKIAYCNSVYAGIVDKTIQEILQNNYELAPPKRSSSPFQLSRKALELQHTEVDRLYTIIAGSRRFLEVGATPCANGGTVEYAIDLTEVDHLEKEIQKRFEGNQQILHQISSPIAVYGEDTRLTFFNQAYVKLFDFQESWLLTKPTLGEILDYLRSKRKLPEFTDFQKHKKERIRLFRTLLEPFEELSHHPDGRILRMCITPHPMGGIVYIFEDITEKINLERQYNTFLAVQRDTIDHLKEGILVFGSDYRLRIMNLSACSMIGITEQNFYLGMTLHDFLQKNKFFEEMGIHHLGSLFVDIFSKRVAIHNHFHLNDGRTLRYAYSPLPDSSHLVSLMDITDSVRAQEGLRKQNRILEERDQLKSHLLQHVSHEIKNPLSALHNHISRIQQTPHKEMSLTLTEEIIHSTQNIISVVDNMLDLAVLDSGQLTLIMGEIDLQLFCQHLTTLLSRDLCKKESYLCLHVEPELTHIFGDEKRFMQAFLNVFLTIIHSQPQQSHLSLLIQTSSLHKGVLFRIHNQQKTFQKFYSFKKEFNFILACRMIDMHGGKTLDHGTDEKEAGLFDFVLPLRPMCVNNNDQDDAEIKKYA